MWAIAWEEALVQPWRYSNLSSCSGPHSGKIKDMLCVYLAFTSRCKKCMRSNTLSCGLPLLLSFIMCYGYADTSLKTIRVANGSELCKYADSRHLYLLQELLFPHCPQMYARQFSLRSYFLGEMLSRQWLTVILSPFSVRTQTEKVVGIIVLFLMTQTGFHLILVFFLL